MTEETRRKGEKMPYIKQERRKILNEKSQLEILGSTCQNEGELNFVLTMICKGYLNKFGMIKYTRLNSIIGVLECCKLEFYRRAVTPYEDLKIKEPGGGDVY